MCRYNRQTNCLDKLLVFGFVGKFLIVQAIEETAEAASVSATEEAVTAKTAPAEAQASSDGAAETASEGSDAEAVAAPGILSLNYNQNTSHNINLKNIISGSLKG